jgi:aminoglycoside phosphotransferase (APT) family kinase protein
MTTVGDPLVDLGCTLCYWPEAGDPPGRSEAIGDITAGPGWYTRAQLVDEYARQTGRDVSLAPYYEVFGLFKVAVVLEQIYFRYWRGQTQDERFAELHGRVHGLIDTGVALAKRAG